jgi:hypothetical protein
MRRGGNVVKGLTAFAALLPAPGLGFHLEAVRG